MTKAKKEITEEDEDKIALEALQEEESEYEHGEVLDPELAISTDFKWNGKTFRVTGKQRRFADLYMDFIMNPDTGLSSAADALIEAGYDAYYKDKDGESTENVNWRLAYVMASQNLRNAKICAYINSKLKEVGYNEANVDLQHAFLINQHGNLPVKLKAIEHFDKKKGRIFGQQEETSKNKAETKKLEQELKRWANDGNDSPEASTSESKEDEL